MKTPLPDFANSLYERFQRENIPLLLAGGWAVCHHGYSRFTTDIDWICSREHEKRAIELMTSLGFSIVFEAMATRFQHQKHRELPPVDLIWVSVDTFAKMQGTDQRTGPRRNMPVIDLESLLAMKIHALKDHEKRDGRDILDIRLLLKNNPREIGDEKLRKLCDRFGPPNAYELIQV